MTVADVLPESVVNGDHRLRTEKSRIAVSLSMPWAARNIVQSGLLEKLCGVAEVHTLLRFPEAEMEKLCRKAGAETWVLPARSESRGRGTYARVSSWLDHATKEHRALRCTQFRKERSRRTAGLLKRGTLALKDYFYGTLGWGPLYRGLHRIEGTLYRRSHPDHGLREYFCEKEIGLLLLTAPFQGHEAPLMYAARDCGIKTVSLVLGFDNLMTKKRQPVPSDFYLTWNEAMQTEVLQTFPECESKRVYVTGSPQFDFYADPKWGYDARVFREKLSLPVEGPLILYAAGSSKYVPYEQLIVRDLIQRVRQTEAGKESSFIVRLHPFERKPERWSEIAALEGVRVTPAWQTDMQLEWGMIRPEEIHLQCGSLRHSSCVINICSTMSLDAIFCDRPVISPAYDLGPEAGYGKHVERLYEQEHYLPVSRSGAIDMAYSPEAAVEAIVQALKCPEKSRPARQALTAQMLGVPIGQSSVQIANLLHQLAQ